MIIAYVCMPVSLTPDVWMKPTTVYTWVPGILKKEKPATEIT